MTIQVYKPRARKRYTRMLATLGTIVIGALGAVAVNARAASADPTVHTLVANTPESWAPHVSDEANTIGPSGTHLTISCYMSGDTVAGPYGPEKAWDLISGGPSNVWKGMFVPDADIYTGSNSPVVPRCPSSWASGRILGNGTEPVYDAPSNLNSIVIDRIASGLHVVIKCTARTTWYSGPYGRENIWDKLTAADGPNDWVPDALVYTGSNSAVAPQC